MLASTAHDRDSEAWHEDLSDLQARVQFYEELHGADPTDEGWTADMAREASVLTSVTTQVEITVIVPFSFFFW